MRDLAGGVLTLVACVLLLAVTSPVDYGDTPAYVSDILAHRAGPSQRATDPLWEFGHVLWRPLGYAAWRMGRPILESPGDPPAAPVYRALASLSTAFSVLLALLLYAAARVYAGDALYAGLIAVGFFSTNGVLNFAQAGVAYVPGLACAALALWLIRRGCARGAGRLPWFIGAGAAMAGAISFWLPFVLSVPALAVVIVLWARSRQERVGGLTAFGLALGATIIAVYGVAVWQAGIGTVPEARAWYRAASHGVKPYHGVARLATGLPRGFYDLGQDGVILKRLYLGDVYAPVTGVDLLSLSWWKLFVFYAWLGFLARALWRSVEGRRMLLLQVAAWGPALMFAAFVFEPSSRERFLPAFPFLVLAAAFVTDRCSDRKWKRLAAVFPLLLGVVVNVSALTTFRSQREFARDVGRIESLKPVLAPESRVVVLSLRDGIGRFQSRNPFHPLVRDGRVQLYIAVGSGSEQAARWRQALARQALGVWERGGDVWVSERLLAARPKPEWLWAEGEDPGVRWVDLPAFFAQLEYDRIAGGEDGFRRLARGAGNRAILEGFGAARRP